jgi:hypothetical protein
VDILKQIKNKRAALAIKVALKVLEDLVSGCPVVCILKRVHHLPECVILLLVGFHQLLGVLPDGGGFRWQELGVTFQRQQIRIHSGAAGNGSLGGGQHRHRQLELLEVRIRSASAATSAAWGGGWWYGGDRDPLGLEKLQADKVPFSFSL